MVPPALRRYLRRARRRLWVGVTTVYRYIHEAITVLAAVAPTLEQAATAASAKVFVVLDGTLLPIDRITTDRPFHSGNHEKHGLNVQVLPPPPVGVRRERLIDYRARCTTDTASGRVWNGRSTAIPSSSPTFMAKSNRSTSKHNPTSAG